MFGWLQSRFVLFQIAIRSAENYGEYKCKARNDLGSIEQVIELMEGKRPESPREFFLRGFNSDTFHVDVGAKVDPKNRHKMEINGYRFEVIAKDRYKGASSWKNAWVRDYSIADGATYLISPFSENTTYLIRVASRNVAGYSDWTETKEFTTLPKLPFVQNKAARSKVLTFSACGIALFLAAKNLSL